MNIVTFEKDLLCVNDVLFIRINKMTRQREYRLELSNASDGSLRAIIPLPSPDVVDMRFDTKDGIKVVSQSKTAATVVITPEIIFTRVFKLKGKSDSADVRVPTKLLGLKANWAKKP